MNRLPEDCRRELQQLLNQTVNESIEVQLFDDGYQAMETNEKDNLVQSLLSAGQSVAGQCRLTVAGYATDASAMTDLNIPTIVFGPGNPVQAHAPNEFIEIDQLESALLILNKFLTDY